MADGVADAASSRRAAPSRVRRLPVSGTGGRAYAVRPHRDDRRVAAGALDIPKRDAARQLQYRADPRDGAWSGPGRAALLMSLGIGLWVTDFSTQPAPMIGLDVSLLSRSCRASACSTRRCAERSTTCRSSSSPPQWPEQRARADKALDVLTTILFAGSRRSSGRLDVTLVLCGPRCVSHPHRHQIAMLATSLRR